MPESKESSAHTGKNDAKVVKFTIPPATQGAMDFLGLVAMVASMIGFLLKSRWASWAALFACLGSMATGRSAEFDFKSLMTSICMAVASLVVSYTQLYKLDVLDPAAAAVGGAPSNSTQS